MTKTAYYDHLAEEKNVRELLKIVHLWRHQDESFTIDI